MRVFVCGRILGLVAVLIVMIPGTPPALADDFDGNWRSCRDYHGRDRWRCDEARRDRWHERRDKQDLKAGFAVGAIGLAIGAIVIGAAQEAERKRQNEQYSRNHRDARCLARYRTYDPRSGTFVGRDGRRYECP